VDPDEVVEHEVKRHRMPVVVDLLREGVGKPREPSHGHPHREVLPLDVACRDVLGVRIPGDRDRIHAKALCRAVARVVRGFGPVDLDQTRPLPAWR